MIVPIVCQRCRLHQWQIATGIIDTGGKFSTNINNPSKFVVGFVYTVGKFAAGVVYTGGKYATGVMMVHLDLQISPQIFEKIRNDPNAILWGWGETNS